MGLRTATLIITLVLTIISVTDLQALQSGTIRGTVVDAITHEPLPGANLIIPDSKPLISTSAENDTARSITLPLENTRR